MSNAAPIYIQIADRLRHHIQAQVYQVGDQLPPESQLSQQFSVNRHTLRQAIALLRQEGLLRAERGRGTFVAAPIRYAIGQRVRYNEALKAQGHIAQFTLLRAIQVPAEISVATGLAISPGNPVALIERLGMADGEPISVGSGYFPLAFFPDLLTDESLATLEKTGSISKWLAERYGVDHIRRRTAVSARLVQPEDAKLLQLSLNQPILLAESINVDQTGRLIEYGVARMRGDRMELVFDNTA
ncbi:MAG: phosphonate metabolism transcriptional regulator PhnF [Leptolyngbya foveolarum]|uniref:Phosphonate metabolism transcriptional regulator PhnF n=1 Tax=Leptolyngbya foveolarum TaxID=47253 RepID=A0A2W4VW32_9CYAN|nr:MAG: phosphonate metabolism transcriptional regulator PhnF [Leptolyngbya foveolarum]